MDLSLRPLHYSLFKLQLMDPNLYQSPIWAGFSYSIIPFLKRHIFNDISTVTSSHDHQTGHNKISNISDAPCVNSENQKLFHGFYLLL